MLRTGAAVDLGERKDLFDLLRHPDRPLVAVVDRRLQHLAVFIEQGEIHPPGVDPDRVDGTLAKGAADPLLDLEPEPENVPIDDVSDLDGIVLKAVDLGHVQPTALDRSDHGASARSAEIKCQYPFSHSVPHTRGFVRVSFSIIP